ncbi:hypothetical protein MHM93_10955 [Pseudoalteromonas sp. MM17-2]|uniref:hypothetical protein n=1 Tax=Pseudoalteromonas sp. MM17-2 TaxID=2917753 RepID=UPI001EF4C252|nr:hypothetical protein [Pseudoalteromonas sp. MM17-2]MCG7544699.1 hypothetical protein [Pseudoalteromonas sp. MM17-2]
MIFQKLKTRVRNDWDEPNIIKMIDGILAAFETFPEHYHDSYSSIYTIENILADDEELTSDPKFRANLMLVIDYLVSDSVNVLSLSYSVHGPEGLIPLSVEELREAYSQGFYVFDNGEAIDSLNDNVVITFGLSDTYFNE